MHYYFESGSPQNDKFTKRNARTCTVSITRLFTPTTESERYGDDAKDFLSFPLKKPKLEVDRDEVLDMHKTYIKEDPEEFSFPRLKEKRPTAPCITTKPNVKVHFLGLKKVSI